MLINYIFQVIFNRLYICHKLLRKFFMSGGVHLSARVWRLPVLFSSYHFACIAATQPFAAKTKPNSPKHRALFARECKRAGQEGRFIFRVCHGTAKILKTGHWKLLFIYDMCMNVYVYTLYIYVYVLYIPYSAGYEGIASVAAAQDVGLSQNWFFFARKRRGHGLCASYLPARGHTTRQTVGKISPLLNGMCPFPAKQSYFFLFFSNLADRCCFTAQLTRKNGKKYGRLKNLKPFSDISGWPIAVFSIFFFLFCFVLEMC